MRRHIVIGCICLLLCCVMTLASCEQHIHTGAEEWTFDETTHWHAATCEHTAEKLDSGEHVWGTPRYFGETEEIEETCTVCGYVRLTKHVHTYTDWKHDIYEHWKRTTCTIHSAYNVQRNLHDWDEPRYVETNAGTVAYYKCLTCGAQDVQDHKHTWEKVCDLEKMEETWICTVCGHVETHEHVHTLSDEWETDEWSHWHMTTCDLHEPVRQGEEGHVVPWGVLSDKILTGVCIGCTQEGSVTHDTCRLKTSSDGRQHYSITTCNSHDKVKYDSVDCTRELRWGDAMHWYETTCPEHGAARSAMESCTFAPGYQYDETEHWWITDCKDEKKNPKHDSYEYGRSSHAFDDEGMCVCGFSRPQPEPQPEGVLS